MCCRSSLLRTLGGWRRRCSSSLSSGVSERWETLDPHYKDSGRHRYKSFDVVLEGVREVGSLTEEK